MQIHSNELVLCQGQSDIDIWLLAAHGQYLLRAADLASSIACRQLLVPSSLRIRGNEGKALLLCIRSSQPEGATVQVRPLTGLMLAWKLKLVIRVLIADDHAIFQRGLREILVRSLKDVICGAAENAHQVLTQVQTENWDLVILDITMPGRSGLDVLDDLVRVKPKLPVLVLSMHPEDHYGMRALKAGAAGYVMKGSTPEELIKAIHKVLGGGRYVTPALAEKLAVNLRGHNERAAHEALSDREFEIFRMIGSGKTVGQIAAELHLSITTVSTYRARILEKMNIATNSDIIRYALHNHLVD